MSKPGTGGGGVDPHVVVPVGSTEEVAGVGTGSKALAVRQAQRRRGSRRGRCFCYCLILLPLVLGGIAILLFFLWPRMPDVSLVSASPDAGSLVAPSSVNSASAIRFSFLLPTVVSVQSDNYLTFRVARLLAEAYQASYGSGTTVLGTVDKNDITIPGRSTTTITLPVNVTYVAANDPSFTFLQSLITACRSRETIPLNVDITLSFSILAWTGYNPKFRVTPSLECPLPQSVLNQVSQSANLS